MATETFNESGETKTTLKRPPASRDGEGERAGTEYVVLSREGEGLYRVLGTQVGHNAEDACRRKGGEKGGAFRAVPVRNWRGGAVSLEPEQITRLKVTAIEGDL